MKYDFNPNLSAPEWTSLPFLSTRDYLHGTTLLKHLRLYVPQDAQICFRILRKLSSNSIRVWDSAHYDESWTPAARLDWTSVEGENKIILVQENENIKGLKRIAYDEVLVQQFSTISQRTITFNGKLNFDVVETAVPLFKSILNFNNYTPKEHGQWMFTRLDSKYPDLPFTHMSLKLELIRPLLVAKSSVKIDGTHFGEMYFSWSSIN